MDFCRLSSPPSLPTWSKFIRAVSSWALSIQGEKLYTHSGQPVPVFDLLYNNKKPVFFCLSGNSVFLFIASYPITGHYWEKCVSAVPCPGIYPHSSQSVCWPPASPGPSTKLFSTTPSPVCTGALGFSSPVQGFAFPLLNCTSFLLADYFFLHD